MAAPHFGFLGEKTVRIQLDRLKAFKARLLPGFQISKRRQVDVGRGQSLSVAFKTLSQLIFCVLLIDSRRNTAIGSVKSSFRKRPRSVNGHRDVVWSENGNGKEVFFVTEGG